nr:MAG TPA: adenine-specific methyltransferase [Ackermannviridae sp.]
MNYCFNRENTIKIYNCDCNFLLDNLISKNINIDLILIDPPYELDNHGKGKKPLANRMTKVKEDVKYIDSGFDYISIFDKFLKLQKIPNILIFCSNKQISRIMSYFENRNLSTTLLVWKKSNPAPLCNGKYISDSEFIIYVRGKGAYFNNDCDISLKYKVKTFPILTNKNKLHIAQKPLELIEQLIALHTRIGDVVLDCFMGSGTTALGCKNLNRKFIGCDIDLENFENTKKRLEL